MTLFNCSNPAALAEKDRQLVWLLARQMGEAQASPGCTERCERLWQEVAALGIDPERVITLLYGGHDLHDPQALAALDPGPDSTQVGYPPPRRLWGMPRLRIPAPPGGGRRSTPRAAAPAHPAAR